MSITITTLSNDNRNLLTRVAPGVLDHAIQPELLDEFLHDPRHHLAMAIDADTVVGMASGVHYVHPDKPPQLFINEVAVAPAHRNHGIGQQLLRPLLEIGRQLGCTEAWVLTDRTNAPALRLYSICGGIEASSDQVMFTFNLRVFLLLGIHAAGIIPTVSKERR